MVSCGGDEWMNSNRRDLLAILVLPVCAVIMSLKFGGNGNTFYAWLLGNAALTGSMQICREWFMFLVWVYMVSLVAEAILEILHKYELGRQFAVVNTTSILLCMIVGFLEGCQNSICVGMILLLLVSLCYWLLPSGRKQA